MPSFIPEHVLAESRLKHVSLRHTSLLLQALAQLMGTSTASLFIKYADHATAHAFWVGLPDFERFMVFVDDVVKPEDFTSVVRMMARPIARQVRKCPLCAGRRLACIAHG